MLGFKLLVGQKKQFKDVMLDSGTLTVQIIGRLIDEIAEKIHVFNVFGHISRNVDLTDDIMFLGRSGVFVFL